MTTIRRNTAAAIVLLLATSTSVNGFSTPRSATIGRPTTPLASMMMDEVITPAKITVIKPGQEIEIEAKEEKVVKKKAVEEVKPAAKSWDDDGFIFGMEGSGLERPKGKVANVVVAGDTLESTPTQQAIVWSTLIGHAGICGFSCLGMLAANQGGFLGNFGIDTLTIGTTAIQAFLVTAFSWTMADLGSGVLHWSVDNYGNGKTPILGGIIAAFQGHHSAPWTICERDFENNVHKLCIPFGIQTVLAMKLVFGLGPAATLFWSVFCVMEIMSQEFHKMSHVVKAEAGPVWNGLQDMGLTINRKSHAQHHIAPYDGNYCIVTGLCNNVLDKSGFFRRLEHVVFKLNGIESNAWKLDAKLRERTLSGDYGLPKSKSKR